MAIKVAQSFQRTSANPIDDSIVLTKAEMLAMDDTNQPDVYFAVCKDDGNLYTYSKTATPSAETGKFKLVEGGGGGGTVPAKTYTMDWDATNKELELSDGTITQTLPLTGLQSELTAGENITIDPTTNTISATGGSGTLTPATTSTLGGVIVGDGLNVEADGTLSTDGTSSLSTSLTTDIAIGHVVSGRTFPKGTDLEEIIREMFTGTPVTYYTVTFDSDGGSPVSPQSVASGDTAHIPTTPTKQDHAFDYWADPVADPSLQTPFDFTTPISEDITLKAVWITPAYEVSFNTDGGSPVTTQIVGINKTATRPADPTKSGYTFDNWYTDNTFTTLYDFSTPVVQNTTIYAKFELVPAIVPDMYMGMVSGYTNANFQNADVSVLTDPTNVLATKLASETPYYQATVKGDGNTLYVFYIMVKDGLEPTDGILWSNGMQTGWWDTADFKNSSSTGTWRAAHGPVQINGITYAVYGYRARFNDDDAFEITVG